METSSSTAAASRFKQRGFARFIGEPVKARLNSSCDRPRISRGLTRVLAGEELRTDAISIRSYAGLRLGPRRSLFQAHVRRRVEHVALHGDVIVGRPMPY